jgi:hypothetical protein
MVRPTTPMAPPTAAAVAGPLVACVVVVVLALSTASTGLARGASRPGVTAAAVVSSPAPRPMPPDPSPPTAGERAAFQDIVHDDDILQIPPCRRPGMATTGCRDPMSYLTSNEGLQSVWLPWIENLGGGFVGVGADQTYSLIAAARSRWAWLFDYDPQVVHLHRVVQTLVAEHDRADDFVASFARRHAPLTRERLKARLAGDPDVDAIVDLFDAARARLFTHYTARRYAESPLGWLNDDGRYRYIRLLVVQGRIQSIKGNMLTDKALPAIAASARAVGVPVRVYYPSNAEEMWRFTPQYRANVAGFPFDDQSIVLRTLFNKKGPWDDQHRYWHYVVHRGLAAQQTIADASCPSTRAMMRDRRRTAEPILSAIGFD